jgi:hypothetical protein
LVDVFVIPVAHEFSVGDVLLVIAVDILVIPSLKESRELIVT